MIHGSAETGYSKASNNYVSGRPDYPTEVGGWLRNEIDLCAGKTVLDLGAGTGKFTKWLTDTGAQVIAVEPVAAMREKISGAIVLDGSAQDIPLEDGSVDAVICAQAFHWFASDATLSEIHRVLKPEGKLGLIWSVRDESVGWVKTLTDIMTPYEGDTPRHGSGTWQAVFPSPKFFQLSEAEFMHAHIGSPMQVIVNRVASVSFIAALPKIKQAEVLAEVHSLIDSSPELAGKNTVSFPYETQAYCFAKKVA